MDFSEKLLMTENYKIICEKFFKLAKNDEVKEKMKSILLEGKYKDYTLNTKQTRDNPDIERDRRIGMAYLLAMNPESFDVIQENNINLFHGTNINALPNILKYGMNSVDKLTEKGIDVETGEKWSRIKGKRDFVSFSDDLNTSLNYATMTETAGVVIGISAEDLEDMEILNIYSNLPEVGVKNQVPLEKIKFIGVPEDKLEFTKKMVNNDKIKIVPMEMDERFYYSDVSENMFEYYEEYYNKLLDKKETQKPKEGFKAEEIFEASKERKQSGIINMFSRIKRSLFKQREEKDANDLQVK